MDIITPLYEFQILFLFRMILNKSPFAKTMLPLH